MSQRNKLKFRLNDEPYTVFVSHPEPGKVIVSYNTHIFEVIRKDILPAQTDFNIAISFYWRKWQQYNFAHAGKSN